MTLSGRPPGRYDDPRTTPRWAVALLASMLGAALLAATVLAWHRSSEAKVPYTVLGYTVVDDSTVEVRFEVHADAGSTATCLVQARDRDGRVVAVRKLTVGPSVSGTTQATTVLSTTGRAATGEVTACRP
jgi:uncharacterized protein (DUF58 family)